MEDQKTYEQGSATGGSLSTILSITKEEIKLLPLLQFEGDIEVVNTREELAEAVDELSRHEVIGFDTEARPSFRKGEYHPTSLVQLSSDDTCFLVRILETGFTNELAYFFEDDRVQKIGIALHDDLTDLQRNRRFQANGFLDLNVIATNMGMENIGAKNLSGIFLKGRISKNQQTSNWENKVLTEAQQIYAATDAWVCLKVYEEILQLRPDILQDI